jgi:hypothetical protein
MTRRRSLAKPLELTARRVKIPRFDREQCKLEANQRDLVIAFRAFEQAQALIEVWEHLAHVTADGCDVNTAGPSTLFIVNC